MRHVAIPPRQSLSGTQTKIAVTIEDIPGIWAVRTIEDQAQVSLKRWQIFDRLNPDGSVASRHFVGFNIEDREGRVSSAIVEFDAATQVGRTASGRIYRLVGAPGHDPDADYVMATWLKMNGAAGFRFVDLEACS